MAETKSREMSKHEFSIAYDGAALAIADVHSIDVQALAPALLAFGKLNRRVSNGDQVRRVTAVTCLRSSRRRFAAFRFSMILPPMSAWSRRRTHIVGLLCFIPPKYARVR